MPSFFLSFREGSRSARLFSSFFYFWHGSFYREKLFARFGRMILERRGRDSGLSIIRRYVLVIALAIEPLEWYTVPVNLAGEQS